MKKLCVTHGLRGPATELAVWQR
uniref:Uncharacterized protein n=1 Tax=Arundo donax TaxID=35708 RepID=A0A0A9HA94_ARUDO